MLRKGLLLAAAFVCLLPAVSSAQVRGPFEIEFAASGANGNKFNGFSGALNVGLGYFITQDQIEIGVRQSLQYTDIGVPRSLNGSTRIAADFHIPLGDQNQFLPFVGVNIGYVYGDSVRDTWELAPEAGLKWFVGNDVFVYAQVEYQFFFRSGSNIQNGFNNGEWVYSAGIGFRF